MNECYEGSIMGRNKLPCGGFLGGLSAVANTNSDPSCPIRPASAIGTFFRLERRLRQMYCRGSERKVFFQVY